MTQTGNKTYTSLTFITPALIFLGTILLLKYFKWQLNRRRMYKLANSMHQSPWRCAPFVGHSYHFYGDNEHILNTVLKLTKYPDPLTLWMGPILVVHISRAEDLEKVFNSPFAVTKSYLYNFGKDIIGDGIFLASGSKWKRHRKLILPTFNQKILDSFVDVFVKHINILMNILETQEGVTDFTEIIASCTVDVICETVMGVEMNAQKSYCKFAKYLQRVMDIVGMRIFNIWLHPSLIYYLTPMCYEQKKIITYIQNFTKDVLATKKKEMNLNNNSYEPVQDEENTSKKKIFLEFFLEMSNNGTTLTDQEIVDEVNTFLVAGIDTSATVSSFVLLMLAMFPEIQQKVYEEAIEVLGVDGEVQTSDLPKMVYLERVIKETMRIFPIGPLVVRSAEEDIKLEKYTIPKGAQISLTIIGTQRNPEYFKDPLKFDPDRFLPEEVAKRHPYSYVPFTAGIRKCIGPRYAYMFMKSLLSKIVRKFTLETHYKSIEEVRLKESMVLRAVEGFPIKVKLRN